MADDSPDVPPTSYRTFCELPGFTARWKSLKFTDADLLALQAAIMADPSAGPVVKGTGRLRKLRFVPPSLQKTGKSGAARVYYAHYVNFGTVLLASMFVKSSAGDLSAAQRKVLTQLTRAFGAALQQRRDERRKGKS